MTIYGVGLLGGSLALALRSRGASVFITGYGRSEARLRKAMQEGIIDAYCLDHTACKNADLVVLATPVDTFTDCASGMSAYLKPGAIVTDVGSVKGSLVYQLESILPSHARFVAAHPIAGGESAGFEAARADLFAGEICIITPTPKTDPDALKTVAGLWESVGMRIAHLSPERHDEVFAKVSHLPHILAYALVDSVAENDPDALTYAGSGFRDTTRIAQSSPDLWAAILMANRQEVIKAGAFFEQQFQQIIHALAANDWDGLKTALTRAQTARSRVADRKKTGE
jgi:prephenate dehydrogenase